MFHLQSRWDDHELLPVVWRGDSLEGLEPLEGVLSTLGLVRGHATDLRNNFRLQLKDGEVRINKKSYGAPEDLGGSPEVERSTGRLDVAALLQEVEVLQLVTVEVAAHVDALTPLDNTFSWPTAPLGRLWRPFGSCEGKK